MLKSLVRIRRVVLIACVALFACLWALSLVYGDAEDKVGVLILSAVIPLIVYAFIQITYRIVSINAPFRVMKIYFWLFIIGGFGGTVLTFISFIVGFPNGLTIGLGASLAFIMATLDYAKRAFDKEEKDNL